MDEYIKKHGYELDINEGRHHHEIYLSDPRKTAPEKLKTVIRHPIPKKYKLMALSREAELFMIISKG